RKKDRRPAAEEAGGKGIEKRRILMSMNYSDAFSTPNRCQFPHAAQIDSVTAIHNEHTKTLCLQLLAELTQCIQANEDKAIIISQSTAYVCSQNFGTANIQTMDRLANGRLAPGSIDIRLRDVA